MGAVDDPLEIANCLNEHFCSIGKNSAKNVRNNNEVNHMSFLTTSVSASIVLQPAPVSEVCNAMMFLNNCKSQIKSIYYWRDYSRTVPSNRKNKTKTNNWREKNTYVYFL